MRFAPPAVLVAIAATTSAPAFAQQALGTGFATNRFEPAERGSSWFVLDSLDLRGDLRLTSGLVTDYAYRSIALQRPDGSIASSVVRNTVTTHAGCTLFLSDAMRIGLDIPAAIYQDGHPTTLAGVRYPSPGSAAVGDPRLTFDVRILGDYALPFRVAVGVSTYFPAGTRDAYTGDETMRVAPHVLIAGRRGSLVAAARLGYMLRPLEADYGDAHLGSEMSVGAAVGAAFGPIVVGPEAYGSTIVSTDAAFTRAGTPAEVLFGSHASLADFQIGAGLGTQLAPGIGAAHLRAILSLEWAPRQAAAKAGDRDHDGVLDDVDVCPDAPGEVTGDPATNGCPPVPPPPQPAASPPPAPPPDADDAPGEDAPGDDAPGDDGSANAPKAD